MSFTFQKFFRRNKKQVTPMVIGSILVVAALLVVGSVYGNFLKTQLPPITNGPFGTPKPSTSPNPKPSISPTSTPSDPGKVFVECEKNPMKVYELQYNENCLKPSVATYQGKEFTAEITCGAGGKVLVKGAVANSSFSCGVIEKYGNLTVIGPAPKGSSFTPRCILVDSYKAVPRNTCRAGLEPVLNVNGKGYKFTLSCQALGSNVPNTPAVRQEFSKGSWDKITNQLVCGTFANTQ